MNTTENLNIIANSLKAFRKDFNKKAHTFICDFLESLKGNGFNCSPLNIFYPCLKSEEKKSLNTWLATFTNQKIVYKKDKTVALKVTDESTEVKLLDGYDINNCLTFEKDSKPKIEKTDDEKLKEFLNKIDKVYNNNPAWLLLVLNQYASKFNKTLNDIASIEPKTKKASKK